MSPHHGADLAAARTATWEEARKKAADVVGQMTYEEQCSLLHGSHSSRLSVPDSGFWEGYTPPIPRLGVPALKMNSGGQGLRPLQAQNTGTTTAWPCLLALAATWDERLVGRVAGAIGREFRGKGANAVLGPGVNVHRVTNGGRNFEYLSGEDPYLGARLAHAYVRGVQAEGVMAVVQNFGFSEQELNRGIQGSGDITQNSVVEARTAWELYYPPFEAAVEAGAGAVMCSHNRVNGTRACESSDLLQRDLKGAMGFKGFVVSAWGATPSDKALEHGLEQNMPGPNEVPGMGSSFLTASSLRASRVNSTLVREAATRVLASIYKLRLEASPGCDPPKCRGDQASDQRSAAHRQLARDAAAASVIVLKDTGVLPIDRKKTSSLAILGKAAHAQLSESPMGFVGDVYGGGGTGHVQPHAAITPREAIRGRAESLGINVSAYGGEDAAAALDVARAADLAIVVVATSSSESVDRPSLTFDREDDALIAAVSKIRPTVVLMQTPGAVMTPWRGEVAALANLFLGGEETGSAWAAVLFGDVPPEGRLPVVLPARAGDARLATGAEDVPYREGLLTSYRSPTLVAAFPFGHGLSLTEFRMGPPQVVRGGGCQGVVCVRVAVENVGRRGGKEVPQAYLHFPGAPEGTPRLALRGFRKTRLLNPAEEEQVVFAFSRRDLSVYDARYGWVVQETVVAHVGVSSADIRHVLTFQTNDSDSV